MSDEMCVKTYLTAKAECTCGPQEKDEPRPLSWECEHCGGHWMVRPDQVPLLAEAAAEISRLQGLIDGMAARLSAQSELLAKRSGQRSACIFCRAQCLDLIALKAHSAVCAVHPLAAEVERLKSALAEQINLLREARREPPDVRGARKDERARILAEVCKPVKYIAQGGLSAVRDRTVQEIVECVDGLMLQ